MARSCLGTWRNPLGNLAYFLLTVPVVALQKRP